MGFEQPVPGWLTRLTYYSLFQIDSEDLLSPYHEGELEDGKPILYPLHYGVAVSESAYSNAIPERILKQRQHVRSLHEMAGRYVLNLELFSLCR